MKRLSILVLLLLLPGCAGAPRPSASVAKESTEPQEVVEVGRTQEAGGLVVTVHTMTVTPNKIALNLEARNNGVATVRFLPDLNGYIRVGDRQLKVDGRKTEVSGEIPPGIVQKGTVIFNAPSDLTLTAADLDQIEVNLGDVVEVGGGGRSPVTIAFSR